MRFLCLFSCMFMKIEGLWKNGIRLAPFFHSPITSYFLRENRKDVHSEALEMVKRRLDHFSELTEEDVEEICGILRGMKRK